MGPNRRSTPAKRHSRPDAGRAIWHRRARPAGDERLANRRRESDRNHDGHRPLLLGPQERAVEGCGRLAEGSAAQALARRRHHHTASSTTDTAAVSATQSQTSLSRCKAGIAWKTSMTAPNAESPANSLS